MPVDLQGNEISPIRGRARAPFIQPYTCCQQVVGGDVEPSEYIINIPSGAIIIQTPLYVMRSLERCVVRANRGAAALISARCRTENQRAKCVKGAERIATECPGAAAAHQTFRHYCFEQKGGAR